MLQFRAMFSVVNDRSLPRDFNRKPVSTYWITHMDDNNRLKHLSSLDQSDTETTIARWKTSEYNLLASSVFCETVCAVSHPVHCNIYECIKPLEAGQHYSMPSTLQFVWSINQPFRRMIFTIPVPVMATEFRHVAWIKDWNRPDELSLTSMLLINAVDRLIDEVGHESIFVIFLLPPWVTFHNFFSFRTIYWVPNWFPSIYAMYIFCMGSLNLHHILI